MSLSTSAQGLTIINSSGTSGSVGGLSGFSTTFNYSVLIGQNCATNNATGYSNTFVGNNAAVNSTQGSGNVLLGFEAAPNLFSDNNVLIGTQVASGAYVSGYANVVVGNYAAPSLSGSFSNVMVGTGADTKNDANYVTVLGGGASSSTYGVAVGFNSTTTGLNAISIGANATAGLAGGIAIGNNSLNNGRGSIAIGFKSYTPNANSLAIGSNVSSSIIGSLNIMNRIVGYYSPINNDPNNGLPLKEAPKNATYVIQTNADALKITGGGVLAFCPGAGGGYVNSVQADPDPRWVIGMSANDLAFTSSNGAVIKLVDDFRPGLLDFTAQHRCLCHCEPPLPGRIVIATGKYRSTAGGSATEPTADEAVPIVDLATKHMDPRVFGVVSRDPANEYRFGHLVFKKESHQKEGTVIVVNSAGEGGVWVSNENGRIRNGDLVTTGSSVPGVAVKQLDDLVHSYTVAKITCDCDFLEDAPGPVVEIGEHRVRMCLLGCTYKF